MMIDESYSKLYSYQITPRDAFREYCENHQFRILINTGMFRYVDNRFVIYDEKYLQLKADDSFELTVYAKVHPSDCVLLFSDTIAVLESHSPCRMNPNVSRPRQCLRYSDDGNYATAYNVEDLLKKREEFETQYATHKALTKTFWQRAFEIMEVRRWNSAIFCEKTQLNEKVYSRAKNDHPSPPDIHTAMAICAGLDLDISLTIEILALAGHTLNNSFEHQAYSFAITAYKGRSLHERNEFLWELKIKPLGSK